MPVFRSPLRNLRVVMVAALLGGCSSIDRLKTIGEAPPLSPIDNPTTAPGYKPVQMPMPMPQPASFNPNSLWRNGSRAFFKDQRAHKAKVENETQRRRTAGDEAAVRDFLGKTALPGLIKAQVPSTLIATESLTTMDGKGNTDRKDEINTNIAGVVTQVLPNGNLVIEGRQEVRVNFEVRELVVAGVVRPEDIESDNTIESTKIAQARIAYGGRGQLTDMQQPRYGQQVMDILLPF
jgi:flagellar L-ring protein FlgH